MSSEMFNSHNSIGKTCHFIPLFSICSDFFSFWPYKFDLYKFGLWLSVFYLLLSSLQLIVLGDPRWTHLHEYILTFIFTLFFMAVKERKLLGKNGLSQLLFLIWTLQTSPAGPVYTQVGAIPWSMVTYKCPYLQNDCFSLPTQ